MEKIIICSVVDFLKKAKQKRPFFAIYVVHVLISGCIVNCSVTVSVFEATHLVYKYQMLGIEKQIGFLIFWENYGQIKLFVLLYSDSR